jgi:acyl-CoA synthetase (NDP forming)
MEAVDLNKTSTIISQARREGRKALLETEAKTICMEYAIPVTTFKLAKSEGKQLSLLGR